MRRQCKPQLKATLQLTLTLLVSRCITAILACDPKLILAKQNELESAIHTASTLEDDATLMKQQLADYQLVLAKLGEEYRAIKVLYAFT